MGKGLTMELYTDEAVARSREDAINWLRERDHGYPRTWAQETKDTERRGYEMYDRDWSAPPIAGYETLLRDGFVTRLEDVTRNGQTRAHFHITDAGSLSEGEGNG